MKPYIKTLVAFAFCFVPLLNSAYAVETPPGFADLVEKLTPTVVNISTTQKVKTGGLPDGMQMFGMPDDSQLPEEFRKFFEQFGNQNQKPVEREVYALGSGFIIDENGYIATNNHVIDNAEEITVILSDGTKLKAKTIGRDPKTDLALLKVDAGHKLPAAKIGDSDKSRVGDWVIAIGNPFGLGGTVTAGIISARARDLNEGPFDDFIQTDAAINRGNSGGPMFNMNGEVIGINTAIFSPSGGSVGIGFAVPSQLAKTVFKELKDRGHIDRGWLGVKIQPVTDEIAESLKLSKTYGALVAEVSPDSPASQAGVKSGDVITRFDGKEVKEMHNLPRMVADTPIGKTVDMEIWRNGESKAVSIKVGEMKETEESEEGDENKESAVPDKIKGKEVLGMMLSTLTAEEREKYQLPSDVKGVIVRSVKDDSGAAKNDIQPGDVIVQAGSSAVTTPAEVSAAVASVRKQGRKYVLLRITRGKDMSMFVTVPVEDNKKKEE